MKEFNTTAVCLPSENYMVDLTDRISEIKKDEYIVISLDFQDISDAVFKSEGAFSQGMARIICDTADFMGVSIPDN